MPTGPRTRDRSWTPSEIPGVAIRLEGDRVVEYRLERRLEAADILTLAEAAKFVRKSPQTLVNWAKKRAFPLQRMGGHWVVFQPCLDAFLIHGCRGMAL